MQESVLEFERSKGLVLAAIILLILLLFALLFKSRGRKSEYEEALLCSSQMYSSSNQSSIR